MVKLIAAVIAVLAIGIAATAAFASIPGLYVSGDAGVSLLPDLHFNTETDRRNR